MGKDSSQFLTSLYLGSLSILSFSSCNAESITVFGTPINSPIKYNGVLFDLDSCAIFISQKKLCETNRPRVFYCPPTGIIFLFLFFQTGKTGNAWESYFLLWLPHHRKDLDLDLRSDPSSLFFRRGNLARQAHLIKATPSGASGSSKYINVAFTNSFSHLKTFGKPSE